MVLLVSAQPRFQRVKPLIEELEESGLGVRVVSIDAAPAVIDGVGDPATTAMILFTESATPAHTEKYKRLLPTGPLCTVVIGAAEHAAGWDDDVLSGRVVWVELPYDSESNALKSWMKMVSGIIQELRSASR